MNRYYLGIDVGSTVIKAGIFDHNGCEYGVCGVRSHLYSDAPGFYERDMEELWDAAANAVRGALEKAGLKGGDIRAVSLTGYGNGLHLVDEKGCGVRRAVESTDSRAASCVRQWTEAGSFSKIHPMTLQSLWPAHSLCLAAWFLEHESESIKKAKWLLNVKDYIRMKLTGEAFLEFSDATGSGLINTRDRKIDAEMLAIIGLDCLADKLPPLRRATDCCGHITNDAAEKTGLKKGTPVAAGCYDIDSAGLATGMTDETVLNVIVGSWANNQRISKNPVISEALFSTTAYAVDGYYLTLEGSPTSAANLEWFIDVFLQKEKNAARRSGKSVYALCDAAVANTSASKSSVLFLPFLYGNYGGNQLKGAFLGLEGRNTREDLIRAVYEGVCFSHRRHIEKLARFEPLPGEIRMAGGAARSPQWRQMFADILNRPVVTTKATELGALGACMCACVCAGEYADLQSAAAAMVRIDAASTPDKDRACVYDEKFRAFQNATGAPK